MKKLTEAQKMRNGLIVTVIFLIVLFIVKWPDWQKQTNSGETDRIKQNTNYPIAPSTEDKSSNLNEIRTSICNICGKSFTGNGYEEVSNGVWKLCEYPYTSDICSPSCGLKATSRINNAINNLGNSASSNLCSNCGSGHYVNGFCDVCGAASAAKISQSRSQLQDCPICHGTGIEMPAGANNLNETGRICPFCNGTGKQSY